MIRTTVVRVVKTPVDEIIVTKVEDSKEVKKKGL